MQSRILDSIIGAVSPVLLTDKRHFFTLCFSVPRKTQTLLENSVALGHPSESLTKKDIPAFYRNIVFPLGCVKHLDVLLMFDPTK